MAELNRDADAQIAQSEKDYDQAQELLRGFQASGEIDSLSKAAQLMVGVLGNVYPSLLLWFVFGRHLENHGIGSCRLNTYVIIIRACPLSFLRQLPWTCWMLPSLGIHTLCAQRTRGRIVIARDWKHGRSQLRAHHWYSSLSRTFIFRQLTHDQGRHDLNFVRSDLTPRTIFGQQS